MLPEITVFALGGTIAMGAVGAGDAERPPAVGTSGGTGPAVAGPLGVQPAVTGTASGVHPALTADDLVAAVPELARVAKVTTRSFRQVPSAHLTLDDLIALAAAVEEAVKAGTQGIVITQGTDTIEETAFALDLMLRLPVPVVVTGAMRNPDLPGADGPANLLAAVRVAASKNAVGVGVLVVMNDEIHAAAFVQKRHTSNPAAFRSTPTGPIGWVAEGRVRLALFPGRRPHVPVAPGRFARPVALLTAGLGDDGRLLKGLIDLGYHGLVIEAMGAGHVPVDMVAPLSNIAREIPVVLASRTGAGETYRNTYGFPGAEIDLIGRGLIPAGSLAGPKARVLLSLLLCKGADRDAIGQVFAEFNR